uniref:Uncharacterized protein LOC113794629 n=1 Tax=Dermatophagoides pteronyssinus TaxID=6956 RepID=A0A6P6Y7P1_DERPT
MVQKNEVEFPGITICAPTIFTPKLLSEFYPELTKFINENMNNKQSDLLHNTIKYYESKMLNRYYILEILDEFSVKIDNVIRSCRYKPIRYRYINQSYGYVPELNCSLIWPVLDSIYAGKRCWTYFSRMLNNSEDWKHRLPNVTSKIMLKNDSPDKFIHQYDYIKLCKKVFTRMIFDYNPSITIELELADEQWKNWANPREIGIAVHPAEILPELKHFVYYKLKRNHMMEISFKKRIINETGYNKNCRMFTKNQYGNKTYQSYDECVNLCINLNLFFSNPTCFTYFQMITKITMLENQEYFQLCPHDKQDYLLYLQYRNYCIENCDKD